jgi:serine/threonine-protein kinase RsbW
MAAPGELLRLVAEEAALPRVMAFVRRRGLEAGLPDVRLDELDVVVEELFLNIAKYAYPAGERGLVEIRCAVGDDGRLEVELADAGQAFNPVMRPEPDHSLPLENWPVGGLGIYLARRLTSALSYQHDGGWNRLRFSVAAESGA